MTSDDRPVVLKLGGSLLSLPDLPQRLKNILSLTPTAHPLLVVGGGAAADVVRRWQAIHALSEETAHELAIQAMSLNESLLQGVLPDSVIVADRSDLRDAWNTERLPILSAKRFLQNEEPTAPQALPHDWSATSDSIAAWVVHQLGIRYLTLLKSAILPGHTTLAQASDAGLVDGHFPTVACGLEITWVNLRSKVPRPLLWTNSTETTCPLPDELPSHARS